MTTKARITVFALVLTIILSAIGSTAFAGDQFNLLTGNNEFDTLNEHGFPFIDPWWTLTNKSKDKLDCTGAVVAAFSGDCAFRFKGSATEASKLSQVVTGADLDTLNGFVDDANVDLQLAYQVNSLSTFTHLKAKAIVTIVGSDTKLKSIANFSGTTMIGEFTSWQAVDGSTVVIPHNAVVSKVKVTLANKSSKGQAFIDNVEVLFASQAS